MHVQPHCVLRYQPKSIPLCPAYFLTVDHVTRTLSFVVRHGHSEQRDFARSTVALTLGVTRIR